MYDDFSAHAVMLRDRVRTGSFERAIAEAVKPGDVVVDFGCGSGILSFFSARAGARKVYAVDRSPIVELARRLAVANGFEGIEFVRGEGDGLPFPEPVDVIVSEWMGHFLFHEWMHEPLLSLRDRVLKPGGLMIPESVSLHAGLVIDGAVFEDPGFFERKPYGIDFSLVADWPVHDVLAVNLAADQVLPETALLGEYDMATLRRFPDVFSGVIVPSAPAKAHGIAGWFDARVSGKTAFGTGPFATRTHWLQLLFPLAEPLRLSAGEQVRIRLGPTRLEGDRTTRWIWDVSTPRQAARMDNYVHRAWMGLANTEGRRGC